MPFKFLVDAMDSTLPLKTVADGARQAKVKKHCVWLAYYYKGCEGVDEDNMPDQFLAVALDAICDEPEDFVKRFSHAFRAKNHDVCVSMLFTNTIDAYCQRHADTLRVKEFDKCAKQFAEYCEIFIQ